MANFKKILAAVLSAAMVVTLAPAGVATNVQAAVKATKGTSTLKVSATKATIKAGKTKTIKVTVNKKQTAALKVTLKSSKAAVAKVASKATIKKGAKTTSFKITAKKAGTAKITVSYKTSANKTVKKTIKVTVKNSETNEDDVVVTAGEITLVDAWGLQDGSKDGLVGDTLRLTIPAKLGTMTSIVWYRNGGQIATSNAMGDAAQLTAGSTGGGTSLPGEYYAVAITAKGTTYESNKITLVEAEAAAKFQSFTIANDYTDGSNIVYDGTDTKAVVTVVLNKDYSGTFEVYRKVDSKFKTEVVTKVNTKDRNLSTTGPVSDESIASGTATDWKYRSLTDGSVTYKFKAKLTRGEEYVVVFDQKSITTDSPKSGKANAFETAATAPYVTTPAKVAVTKVSDGNKPEVTFYDENDAAMAWLNGATTKAIGLDSAIIYKSKSKTTTTTATDVSKAFENVGTVVKGVWTASGNADSTAFWFAEVKTAKGVFDAASKTITSEAVQTAQAAATQITLVQNKTTATTATVGFQNLRAAGKLYLISSKGKKSDATTAAAKATSEQEALAYEYDKFDVNDRNSYDSVTDVAVGSLTLDVANAIHAVAVADDAATVDKDERYTNAYIAIFIPEDEANYGKIATLGKSLNFTTAEFASNNDAPSVAANKNANYGVIVSQALAKYELNGSFKDKMGAYATGADMFVDKNGNIDNTADAAGDGVRAIVEKDQFGNEMVANSGTKNWTFTSANGENGRTGAFTLAWTANVGGNTKSDGSGTTQGKIVLTLGSGGTAVTGEKWTSNTSTGQTFTIAYNGSAWSLTLS